MWIERASKWASATATSSRGAQGGVGLEEHRELVVERDGERVALGGALPGAARGRLRSQRTAARGRLHARHRERPGQRVVAVVRVGAADGHEAPGSADPHADAHALALVRVQLVQGAVARSEPLAARHDMAGVGVVGVARSGIQQVRQQLPHDRRRLPSPWDGLHGSAPPPADLPVPEDDGGARHLPGTRLPALALRRHDRGGRGAGRPAMAGRSCSPTRAPAARARSCPAAARRPGTPSPARAGARRSCAACATTKRLSRRSARACSGYPPRTPATSARSPSAWGCRIRSCPTSRWA